MSIIPRAPNAASSDEPTGPAKSRRRNLLYLILFIGLTPVVVIVGVFIYLIFNFYPDTTPRGPLPNIADWPEPLRNLHDEMKNAGIDVSHAQVYLIHGQPRDLFSRVMLREPIPATDVDWIDSNSHIPKDWWAGPNSGAQYFASRQRHNTSSDEPNIYRIARDSKQSWIYIHYNLNF